MNDEKVEKIIFYIVVILSLVFAVKYTQERTIDTVMTICQKESDQEIARLQEQLDMEQEKNQQLEIQNQQLVDRTTELEKVNQSQAAAIREYLAESIRNKYNGIDRK